MQAGNGPNVALNSYQTTNGREYENIIVEVQQLMSERWHKIINLPTSVREIVNFKPNTQLGPKDIF